MQLTSSVIVSLFLTPDPCSKGDSHYTGWSSQHCWPWGWETCFKGRGGESRIQGSTVLWNTISQRISVLFLFFFVFGHATRPSGSSFPNQGSYLGHWQQKCRVLTTAQPENFQLEDFLRQQSPIFLASGTSFVEGNLLMESGGGGLFQDDLSALHWSCTLFLSLLHQLHLRSSSVRPQRLGIPVLNDTFLKWYPFWFK